MPLRKSLDKFLQRFEKEFVTHNRIEILQSAILHNLNLFVALRQQQVIPVLKGNAYGNGILPVAQALKGCDLPYIAVDGYFEALQIREVSKQPVLIMGAILSENYQRLSYDNFAFVVHDEASIDALGQTGRKIKVHLEINTGMNRYGIQAEDVRKLSLQILQYNDSFSYTT